MGPKEKAFGAMEAQAGVLPFGDREGVGRELDPRPSKVGLVVGEVLEGRALKEMSVIIEMDGLRFLKDQNFEGMAQVGQGPEGEDEEGKSRRETMGHDKDGSIF